MKLTKEQAIELYPVAPKSLKVEMEKEFGKDFYILKSWEKIKTLEDALIVNRKTLKEFQEKTKDYEYDTMCYEARKEITKAIRGSWIPNWDDSDEPKYYPYFNMNSSSFGFSVSGYGCSVSDASVGSRLCFPTLEQADHFGKNFTEYHRGHLLME